MNERLRKIILFIVIITVGSITILFDIPFIFMIPLIIGAGFIIMLVLGTITISDIRSLGKKKDSPAEKKPSFFGRFSKAKPEKGADKKTGSESPKRSFFLSFESLGSVFKGIGKRTKTERSADKSPGKTGPDAIKGATPSRSAKENSADIPTKGGGSGSSSAVPAPDQDLILPPSGDEFDASLLDGLNEQDSSSPASAAVPDVVIAADLPGSSTELDIDAAANEILKQGTDAGGLDEFGGLPELNQLGEGSTSDQDFSELEGLSLDDVELDTGEEAKPVAATEAKPTESTSKSPAPAAKPNIVKEDWIKTDAPLETNKEFEQESTQADMLTFAGGGTGDDDLLSSLSTDVKRGVSKKKDLSLLRDLKDFQAPAADIEAELLELYNRLNAIKKPEKNSPSLTKGIK